MGAEHQTLLSLRWHPHLMPFLARIVLFITEIVVCLRPAFRGQASRAGQLRLKQRNTVNDNFDPGRGGSRSNGGIPRSLRRATYRGRRLTANGTVVRGVVWTMGTYVLSVVVRFGSNILLSRLLNPELFGILLIINTIRQGVELSSDVGFAQNVIQNKAGEQPEFFNTIWVMQMARGFLLCAVLFVCAVPIGRLYAVPASAFELSGAILLVSSLTSTSMFLLHRNLQLAKLNSFDLAQDIVGAVLIITAAIINPTIEALLIATLVAQLVRTLTSYVLTSHGNRFQFNKAYALEVLSFGRWIFFSSILMFLCASFDRLYIGKVAPLAVVGVYGIARALSDMPTFLAARIGYSVIFPVVSSAQSTARADVRAQLSSIRFKLLLVAAVSVAFGISIADIAVTLVYDARYHDAGWMLPLLLFGVWPAILCSINEYALLGFGKPTYGVIGNGLKLSYYLTALPLAYHHLGMLGAVITIALSDLGRYAVIGVGQRREQFSFLRQDAASTVIFLLLIVFLSGTRSIAGFGTAFDSVPFDRLNAMFGG
jgi:O-antigen/teichoic acid export membrane protein